MQTVLIPYDVLQHLGPRLPTLFAGIRADDVDAQYLYAALTAAAKLCTGRPLSSAAFALDADLAQPSSPPSSTAWSSPTLGPVSSRAGSPVPLDLDLEGADRAVASNVERKRKLSNTPSNGDRETFDQRAYLRQVARDADADRVAARHAARLRGGWDPDCRRGGDRYWARQALPAAEMEGGLPMVAGPHGLAPDPSLSQDDGYSAGIGTQNSGEVVGDILEDEEVVIGAKEKGKKVRRPKGDWQKVVRKTVLKKDSGQLIASLTAISCSRPQADLFSLVKNLLAPLPAPTLSHPGSEWIIGTADSAATPIASLVSRIESTAANVRSVEFRRMIMLIQLSLLVDYELRHNSKCKNITEVKREAHVTVSEGHFRVLHASGLKLIWLASSASIYIIFIFAALELKRDVINSSVTAVQGLATAFREPTSDEWKTVINRVLIPWLRILQLYIVPTEFADQLLYLPSTTGPVFIQCSDLAQADSIFSQIKMNTIKLPVRSDIWKLVPPSPTLPPPTSSGIGPQVRDAIVIKTPWIASKTSCPVRDANRDEWTAIEREKGEDRIVPADLEELRKLISAQVPSGVDIERPPRIDQFTKVHPYIGVPSTILEGHTLRVEDASGDLVALVVTHASLLPSLRAKLDVLMAELQTAFPGELYAVDTAADPLSKFLALHFTWYNKFSEKGTGAPGDVHPGELLREGALKVNWGQREPRESAEIRNHPSLYKQVTSIMEDILVFIRDNEYYGVPFRSLNGLLGG
ncbi:hypothetical protein HWV62_12757 [Athelia sp. TMB]|nr:hypothetical protein HWV62_12757 [Athelia sp. TMB]